MMLAARHWIATGLAVLPGAVLCAQIHIELLPAVNVGHGAVSLGDVARLTTEDHATLKRFMTLPLGHAPRAGAEAAITRATLAQWVASRLGHPAGEISWSGAAEVTVRSASSEVRGALVEQVARSALSGWLAQRTSRHHLEAVLPQRDFVVPAGQVELSVRGLPESDSMLPRQRVWVDVRVAGEFVRSVPVDFAVNAYRDAWVVPVGLARGAVVTPEAMQRKEVDVARVEHRGAALATASTDDLRTRRTLAAGEVLAARDVERVPAVARGQRITVLSRNGGLELQASAEALQDGQVGQKVRVKTTGAQEPVLALVVAPGRVEVQP
jgi:flagellar basal body P-ring formation protein FlgA